MGIFSRFENKMEDAIDNLGDKLFDSPISPVQIAKKAEKQMRRNKMLGAGKQYAPTLYTVLVNPNDDSRLFGYYPTLAGETETYLKAKANEAGFVMDGDPLVRFIVDQDLKSGKFDVIAEAVAADIISQLRAEENERYGEAARNDVAAQSQSAPSHSRSATNMSSPFADVAGQSVTPAVQNAPAPNPVPAPASVPAPNPVPAPAVPNQVPTPAPAVGMPGNPMQNNVPLSSAKTAIFNGGIDMQAGGSTVPPARLIDLNSGATYQLTATTSVIGRDNTCNIVIPDANASRQHAQISYNDGMWIVSDLGSTNGTFVNNQEITTREIHSGDTVRIGISNLTFNVG